jgi:hypothetical protein
LAQASASISMMTFVCVRYSQLRSCEPGPAVEVGFNPHLGPCAGWSAGPAPQRGLAPRPRGECSITGGPPSDRLSRRRFLLSGACFGNRRGQSAGPSLVHDVNDIKAVGWATDARKAATSRGFSNLSMSAHAPPASSNRRFNRAPPGRCVRRARYSRSHGPAPQNCGAGFGKRASLQWR